MKKLFYFMLSILMFSMVSCDELNKAQGPKPEITITKGEVTESQVEFFLSAKNADEVAYHFMETTDEVPILKVERMFMGDDVFVASEEPVSYVMEGLKSDTEYTVYAASRASVDGEYVYSEISELVFNTSAKPEMLEFVSASKTGFSYKVNVEEGQAFMHAYFDGWFFEYNYEMNKYIAQESGEEFDVSIFILNLLATYGNLGTGSQTISWYAGQESIYREYAFLVPGTRYYAAAALFDEATGMWIDGTKPDIIQFEMDKPGVSSQTVDCKVDGISPYSVNIRMECDETLVNFFMYDFYKLSDYKTYVSENGKEGMKKYVAEYGYGKVNTYTDTWTVEPGTSYMFCLYGVDHNGDDFYTELQVNVPLPDAKIYLSMEPYERELEGYTTYNTLKVSATLADFMDLDYDNSVFYLPAGPIKKADFDTMLESANLSGSIEELEAQGEILYALGQANLGLNPVSVDEEILSALKERGFFNKVYTDLDPDTEYIYMVMVHYDGKIMCRLVSAKTDPAPVDIVESEAYKAFLGRWDVTGQNTETWSNSDRITFNLTIERLTSNRSYIVYGWSTGKLGQEFPFEAGFDEASGAMTISTPQNLGEVVVEGKTYEVHFVGKAYNPYNPDNYMVLYDYEGLAYKVTMNYPYLHFKSEIFQYAGESKDFKSLSYVFFDKEAKEYYKAEPYDLVTGFQTVRVNQ